MENQKAADIFRQIAYILEIKGENVFRIRAYLRAAEMIEGLSDELTDLLAKDKLQDLPGIGKDLAAKIKEIIETGDLQYLVELKTEVPQGVLDMLAVPGVGPKKVKLFFDSLGIDSLDKLLAAAQEGKLVQLKGIEQKTVDNIIAGIATVKKGLKRPSLHLANESAKEIIRQLKQLPQVKLIEPAGSLRRKKETIGDIDLIVVSAEPKIVMDHFVKLPQVKRVLVCGETKSSVVVGEKEIQVDLRVIDQESFGAGLMYFTGSKQFNIRIRNLAISRGYKLNEYGLFKQDKLIAAKQEKDIFDKLGMQFVPAELREDRGEVELALENNLPKLVEFADISGDLHTHSVYSDGKSSIEDMVLSARKLGYKYLAISDHSVSLHVANGLDQARLREKIQEIRRVNEKYPDIKVICGSEVDILSDGSLDYSDDILKQFDVVIAAVHTGFKQTKQQMTKRIVNACKNKYVNILAHPTGMMWGEREPYDLDLDEVFKAGSDNQVAMEINCYHKRIDLNDLSAMKAKKHGLKIAIGSDAHLSENLVTMEMGVATARRAWLTKTDIINCLSFDDLAKWLKKS